MISLNVINASTVSDSGMYRISVMPSIRRVGAIEIVPQLRTTNWYLNINLLYFYELVFASLLDNLLKGKN